MSRTSQQQQPELSVEQLTEMLAVTKLARQARVHRDVALKPGCQVVVVGLAGAVERNGAVGTLLRLDSEAGRWQVQTRTLNKNEDEILRVKPTNIAIIREAEDCAICLYPLVSDTWLLACGHRIHKTCAKAQLGFNASTGCPLCRTSHGDDTLGPQAQEVVERTFASVFSRGDFVVCQTLVRDAMQFKGVDLSRLASRAGLGVEDYTAEAARRVVLRFSEGRKIMATLHRAGRRFLDRPTRATVDALIEQIDKFLDLAVLVDGEAASLSGGLHFTVSATGLRSGAPDSATAFPTMLSEETGNPRAVWHTAVVVAHVGHLVPEALAANAAVFGSRELMEKAAAEAPAEAEA